MQAALIAVPALLLLLPVFYYSLTTPFALVGDYSHWSWVLIIESYGEFGNWFSRRFLDLGASAGELNYRHRTLWELYQAVSWKLFGPAAWLHHLVMWVFHLAAVSIFAAALLRFLPATAAAGRPSDTPPDDDDDAAGRQGRIARLYRAALRLLPLALPLYLWLFFPNSPASRLDTQEIFTALFLGLCTYAMALMLLRGDAVESTPGQPTPTPRRTILRISLPALTAGRRTALLYGLFLLSVLGLGLAKEVNIGVFLWMLLFYYGLIFYRAARRPESAGRPCRIGPLRLTLNRADGWKLLAGLPVIAVFAHTLNRVYYLYIASGFANEGVTGELVAANSTWILEGLFQTATSPLIAAGLALLAAVLLFSVVRRAIRRRFDRRMAFILFLLGQFAALYLVLAASPWEALRYWYGLIPVLALLLAFGAQYGLEWAAGRRWATHRDFNLTPLLPSPRLLAAAGLAAFILFFVLSNYYNFLYQTVVQHSTRHGEAQLFAQIDRLQAQGEYVQVAHFARGEILSHALDYYPLLPALHQSLRAERPGYAQTLLSAEIGRVQEEGYQALTARLGGARELAANVIDYYQYYRPRFYDEERPIYTGPPPQPEQRYYTIEYGGNRHFALRQDYRPLRYAYAVAAALQPGEPARVVDAGVSGQLWYVYDNELSSFRANGREIIDAAGGGAPPLAEADFRVYAAGPHLAYINDSCGPEEAERNFMLHLIPVNHDDLDGWERGKGFANRDFRFGDYGLRVGDTCIALYPLPAYPVLQVRTGQFVPGEEPLWQRTFHHPDALQHLYAAAASRPPAASSTFDIYNGGSELTYLKEPCSDADTAAPFFLHLVPADADNLPPAHRAVGFENRDFAWNGMSAGGRCLASIPLPNYAIDRIRTGQFTQTANGGYRNLWQAEIQP